jgi:predicted N-formylglutamate amidohydrolase
MGMAGDMLLHIHGAEKMKKRMAGRVTNAPVAMFTGRCLVFCNRPPRQKTVFPKKYS